MMANDADGVECICYLGLFFVRSGRVVVVTTVCALMVTLVVVVVVVVVATMLMLMAVKVLIHLFGWILVPATTARRND